MLTLLILVTADPVPGPLPTLKYNNPGLVVDLHVGLWGLPVPCDYDGDGDNDLLMNCPDVPMRGLYFFENGSGDEFPIFEPGQRIGPAHPDLTPSYIGMPNRSARVELLARNRIVSTGVSPGGDYEVSGTIVPSDRILRPGQTAADKPKLRARQFSKIDYDGDGALDLVAGIGDWTDYGMNFSAGSGGWADAFTKRGVWKPGPLRGFVYVLRNTGTSEAPTYAEPEPVFAGGEPIDVYGRPAPNFADFDGDGDLDLVCGEFLDGFTYFANIGTRTEPEYAAGRRLSSHDEPLRMDLQMIVPVAYDWDDDGDVDLIVGDEDGRVAWVEHTGDVIDGLPMFEPPRYFRQAADDVVFGALVTPAATDWDADGDTDLLCGNSAGYIAWIENLGGEGMETRWDRPRKLLADDLPIRLMAGPNGSVQGPSERKWGYTTLSVADWNGDGLSDVVVNSIWGRVVWFENVGTSQRPLLTTPRPVLVDRPAGEPAPRPEGYWWTPEGGELVTQWRTTPLATDWTGDGQVDLVMLDHEGYLALFERRGDRVSPPQRVFETDGPLAYDNRHRPVETDRTDQLLQLNAGVAGRGGRVKLAIGDWTGDGRPDLLVNSDNINLMVGNATADGRYRFTEAGPLTTHRLAGHTTSPTLWDWSGDGRIDAVIGAEDGRLYWLENPGD